jgi:hypothetical protein
MDCGLDLLCTYHLFYESGAYVQAVYHVLIICFPVVCSILASHVFDGRERLKRNSEKCNFVEIIKKIVQPQNLCSPESGLYQKLCFHV